MYVHYSQFDNDVFIILLLCICINQNIELLSKQECYYNKITPLFIILKALSSKIIKNFVS